MNILVLNGSLTQQLGNTEIMADAFIKKARGNRGIRWKK